MVDGSRLKAREDGRCLRHEGAVEPTCATTGAPSHRIMGLYAARVRGLEEVDGLEDVTG
jgi:hypothetical protein